MEQQIYVARTTERTAERALDANHESAQTTLETLSSDLTSGLAERILHSPQNAPVARNGTNGTNHHATTAQAGNVATGELWREVDIAASLGGLKPQLKQIEIEIERLISGSIKAVADVASHTLGAGGKRLRPALTVLCAQLCDDTLRDDAARDEQLPDKVLASAVAVELTHTTTLLHDDVVDSAEVRRGKPAANLLWGNGMSVLVGDYLFAQVFLIASQRGFYELMNPLAQATAQMCAGELLEAQNRGELEMEEKDYLEIVALKTSALTECSCRIGALAVGADEQQVDALARYGHYIGIAFQIVDDVFDMVASKKRIGKPVGNDIREGIITLPMLRAMQKSSADERAVLGALIGKTPIEDSEVERVLDVIRAHDTIASCLHSALEYAARAKAELKIFDDCPARQMLCDIADYVVSREK